MERIRSHQRIIGDTRFKQEIMELNKRRRPKADARPAGGADSSLVLPPGAPG
jgi:hypothetical protein